MAKLVRGPKKQHARLRERGKSKQHEKGGKPGLRSILGKKEFTGGMERSGGRRPGPGGPTRDIGRGRASNTSKRGGSVIGQERVPKNKTGMQKNRDLPRQREKGKKRGLFRKNHGQLTNVHRKQRKKKVFRPGLGRKTRGQRGGG